MQLLKLSKCELARLSESPRGGSLRILLALSDLTETEQTSDDTNEGFPRDARPTGRKDRQDGPDEAD
ncbi:hypothetical protein ACFVYF_18865 [Streptomyces sp. NPDC058274]|uniref:hypothetical protein n=1 Tax=Streptomyces sp. NPDC058274 TaxID=3346416 RepID=UPI0036EC94CF